MKTRKLETLTKGTMLWIHATANLTHAKKTEYIATVNNEKVRIIK